MKIYFPNTKIGDVSGCHTFYRNFKKAAGEKFQFCNTWQECDVFFISGITITNKEEVHAAKAAGKKIILRVDNVPRKSRNRRSTPHERMKEFAELSDLVVYQSEWARNYCRSLCGDGAVVYNGVDTDIFYPGSKDEQNNNGYLFAYHGKNEQKNFWVAHYHFQMEFRKNPKAVFWFIYDFGRETDELERSSFDFWQGENFVHLPKVGDPKEMAAIMQQCKYLIYPAICDASPNVVSESLACGLEVLYPAAKELAGTQEIIDRFKVHGNWTIKDMCDEYQGLIELLFS